MGQSVDPSGEKVEAGQVRHEDAPETVFALLPASQVEQVLSELAPTALVALPLRFSFVLSEWGEQVSFC